MVNRKKKKKKKKKKMYMSVCVGVTRESFACNTFLVLIRPGALSSDVIDNYNKYVYFTFTTLLAKQ